MRSESVDTNEQLCTAWRRDGDPKVRDKLVRLNMDLIRKLASKHKRPHQFDDLVQEGCLGFLTALDKWDPAHGVKVMSYAVWWIRAYQRKYLISTHRIVAFGTTAAQRKLYSHPGACAKLEASGLGATPENVARMLGLDVERDHVADDMARLNKADSSIDADVWNRMQLHTQANAELAFADAELLELFRAEVRAHRQQMSARNRDIFDARFSCDKAQTLDEIGQRYGISRERVRQLEKRTVERLRARMLARTG